MKEKLFFSGVRFKAAMIDRDASTRNGAGLVSLRVVAPGVGRDYSTQNAEGWWRDFADLSLVDDRAVLSFVRRRGDPYGKLERGEDVDTAEWVSLRDALRLAADEVEERGGADVLDEREEVFDPAPWVDRLGVVFSPELEMIPFASELAAYMVASAALTIRRRHTMRRCDYCQSWFNVAHAAAKVCSPSCRAASGQGRVSPHAFRCADE